MSPPASGETPERAFEEVKQRTSLSNYGRRSRPNQATGSRSQGLLAVFFTHQGHQQVGQSTFRLADGRTWNARALARVVEPGETREVRQYPSRVRKALDFYRADQQAKRPKASG